jgi:hypothetical protein
MKWFLLFVFFFFAAPKTFIRIGPIPLYILDFFIYMVWYHSRSLPNPKRSLGLGVFVTSILVIAVVSELFFAIRTFDFVNPIYLAIRTILAVSLFYSVPKILVSDFEWRKMLVPMFWGTGITAIFLILSSIPFTRFLVNPIFAISIFDPASEEIIRLFDKTETAARGRSLVGVSIISGAFINASWPLILGLNLPGFRLGKRVKQLLPYFIILIPFGVFMTYSRGAILGSILVIFIVQLYNSGRYRNQIIAALVVGGIIVNFVGVDSKVFYTERIENRTNAALSANLESTDDRESERILSYVEPFQHVIENPEYLLIGEGTSALKGGRWNPLGLFLGGGGSRADHSVFGKSYYAYGLLAAFLYVGLFLSAIFKTYQNCSKRNNPNSYQKSRLILAALAGISTWFMFDHGIISAPRGAAMLFFIMGIAESQRNLYKTTIQQPKKHS